MAASSDPCGHGNLRDVLVETLNNILSAQTEVRLQAEDHIKVLEVTEGKWSYVITIYIKSIYISKNLFNVLLGLGLGKIAWKPVE